MQTAELKFLMRAEKTAAAIESSARGTNDRHALAAVASRLGALLDEIQESLGDATLKDESKRLVDERGEDGKIFWRDVEPCASSLHGWLQGVVAAETFEVRLHAEAKAVAEARIASERPVGFQKPAEPE